MPSLALIRRSNNRTRWSHKREGTSSSDAFEANDTEKSSPNVKLEDDSSVWCPSVFTVFKLLFSFRLSAAIFSNISDCDEVYNYWEPLHLLLNGTGFQTWEYSPAYAVRTYSFIWFLALPARLYQGLLNHSKVTTFYFCRCFLGVCCVMAETYLYKVICERFSRNIGRLTFACLLLSAGMFGASCAYLPSTFSMIFNMLSMALWLDGRYFWAVFFTAVSTLMGWPFAAILGLPIVCDMLIQKRNWSGFFSHAVLAGVSISMVILRIDHYYFGKSVLAPLNIVLYNVFSQHGPNLYGVEPMSYYLINCILNFNFVFLLSLVALPLTALMLFIHRRGNVTVLYFYLPVVYLLASMWLWIIVFFSQPHKEERFLFPIYPLFCFSAAVALDCMQRLLGLKSVRTFRALSWVRLRLDYVNLGFVFLTGLIAVSRVTALYKGYHAPLDIYMELGEQELAMNKTVNVCLGKEWYRFPSSFFVPNENYKMQFVKSEFSGLLPQPFAKLPVPQCTSVVPSGMNDHNMEEFDRYVPVSSCDFLVDFDNGDHGTALEPNYARDTKHWSIVSSKPFLVAGKSHRIFRAFYVPWLSERYCMFGKYVLLRAVV